MSGRRPATWKQAEREVARRLGGQRVPVTGRGRGDAPDIEHARLSPEVKHRATLPGWLLDAMAQATAAAADGRVPVAVLHPAGGRYDDCLCVLRLAHLVALLAGDAGERGAG